MGDPELIGHGQGWTRLPVLSERPGHTAKEGPAAGSSRAGV